jgi:hypothetical protein
MWKRENTRMSIKADSTAILQLEEVGQKDQTFNKAVDGGFVSVGLKSKPSDVTPFVFCSGSSQCLRRYHSRLLDR